MRPSLFLLYNQAKLRPGNMIDEQTIHNKAKAALSRFGKISDLQVKFGYNRETVAWFEEFIEKQRCREVIEAQEVEDLVQLIGSYLGECLIHTYGGNWREREGTWGVFFDDSNAAFPFSKVRKQFERGIDEGDSILGFFDLIPVVLIKKN